jgi:hypothetical protein
MTKSEMFDVAAAQEGTKETANIESRMTNNE